MKWILIIVYLVLSVGGLILFKCGANMTAATTILNGIIHMDLSIMSIIGILCYLLNFPLYLYLVSKFDLGYIFPIVRGLAFVFIMLSSYFLFREHLTSFQWVGAVLVIVGVVLMNLKLK